MLAGVGAALALALLAPAAPPAGAATGTAAGPAAQAVPDPVVIVNGTLSPQFVTEPLAARLRADGYTVRIFVLTDLGTGGLRLDANGFLGAEKTAASARDSARKTAKTASSGSQKTAATARDSARKTAKAAQS